MKPEFAWFFILAGLGACAVGPGYQERTIPVAARWRAAQNAGMDLKPKDPENLKNWWRRFGDSPLDRLMEQALGGNLDLRMALTRIDQARAERRTTRAELFPSVNLATGVARYSPPPPGLVPPIRFNFFQLGFDALWEIDVFGRQRRRLEAASADLDAGTEQYHQVLVTLTSDVARGYIKYRNLQNQQRITRANLAAQRHTLGLTERLFREGVGTRYEVVRARALAETTGAQLPALEARRIGKLRQLEVLVGRWPTIQLNVDATRMSQAFIGNSYTQLIVNGEVIAFPQGHRAIATLPAEFEVGVLFNLNRSSVWFGSVMEVINSITMLCIVLAGMTLRLFATTSMGIFLGTVARSMPQMGLLMLIILLPLQMLSGGMTPRESMPELVQDVMLAAPTTHFVSLAQAILYRGAGFRVVWPQFLALLAIGSVFFTLALTRFRKTIGSMA